MHSYNGKDLSLLFLEPGPAAPAPAPAPKPHDSLRPPPPGPAAGAGPASGAGAFHRFGAGESMPAAQRARPRSSQAAADELCCAVS